jgi:S-adenosylmethionine:tRNA ribosyltransferase-isomerase
LPAPLSPFRGRQAFFLQKTTLFQEPHVREGTDIPELEDYRYDLPDSLIAQKPRSERGSSRLMALSPTGEITLSAFRDLPRFLPPRSLLVFNDAKVSPARLYGRQNAARVELLILEPPTLPPDGPLGGTDVGGPEVRDLWCLGSPGRRLKVGAELRFASGDDEAYLRGEVLEINSSGHRLVRFHFPEPAQRTLAQVGLLPLPPYIKRPVTAEDSSRYQTVYARRPGAVAAPTAGLHFTPALLSELEEKGHQLAFLNLKVGAGTFLPLTAERLRAGTLHPEEAQIGEELAQRIRDAQKRGQAIVAVGTTTLRALEWAALTGAIKAQTGVTDLFIRPGFPFKVADYLVTNFHLPRSSLLMLVAAFAGRDNVLAAYRRAVEEKFLFFSYGDATLARRAT